MQQSSKDYIQKEQAKAEEGKQWHQKLRDFLDTHSKAKAGKGGKGKSSSSSSSGAARLRKVPLNVNLASARTMCPAHGQIYESFTDSRFRAYFSIAGAKKTFSASHEHYGVKGALIQCLQWLWKQHVETYPQEECPFIDLMDMQVS